MITLEEARRTAEEWLEDICGCTEYETGFVFFSLRDEDTVGGPGSPVAILKENGRRMNLTSFISDVGPGEEIRTIHFSREED